MGAVFSAMKAEYVVVAEQAHPLGPAYSLPIIERCRDYSMLSRISTINPSDITIGRVVCQVKGTVGSPFLKMKTEYVVVAEQIHPLGHFPIKRHY